MASDHPQVKLRLPSDLKTRLEEAAKANNRSLNAEIVDIIISSIEMKNMISVMRETIDAKNESLSLSKSISILSSTAALQTLNVLHRFADQLTEEEKTYFDGLNELLKQSPVLSKLSKEELQQVISEIGVKLISI